MDYTDLKNFTALARTLHFAKASRIVHLSPSALTRSIQRIEEEVGHDLLERNRRNTKLTPAGELFLTFAQKSIDELEKCQALLDGGEDEISGKLSIYSSVTAVYTILQKVLRPFRNQYPKVHINLATGTVADAIGRVLDKEADCAVAAMPDKLPGRISFLPLTTTSLVLIAPKGFDNVPVYSKKGVIDFEKTPIIMPHKDVSREQQSNWFKQQNIRPSIYAEVAGNEAIIAMVSLGFGIGIVPGIVLNQSPLKNTVEIINQTLPLKPYVIGVVYLNKRHHDPLISAFNNTAGSIFLN